MSLIGRLEQLNLASVLQRVEAFSKTGLLVIKQGAHWVEFYFRDGRLMCIGPVRTNATLGERLLHDGLITPHALQETMLTIGEPRPGETRMALTLMDLGHVGHEELRTWSTNKALEVLRIMLTWASGEIHFEEGVAPQADRLLVALSVSSLLTLLPQSSGSAPISQPLQSSPAVSEQPAPQRPAPSTPSPDMPDIAKIPTLMSASQFFTDPSAKAAPSTPEALSPNLKAPEHPQQPAVPAQPSQAKMPVVSKKMPAVAPQMEPLITPDMRPVSAPQEESLFLPNLEAASAPAPSTGSLSLLGNDAGDSSLAISLPVPVKVPIPPRRIDTTFMRPDMLLIPADLSAFREKNPPVQLTPDQWRLLTRADGRTTLQVASQELSMLPEIICQVAGELIAEGLIHVAQPAQQPAPMQELSPVSQEYVASGMSMGYVTPGYASSAAQPWSMPNVSQPGLPFETQSQWGNGGSGATFVPGRGWVASPPPQANNGSFAPVGGR
ncbi:DUF4388 domain-containing protein [Ktedonosporobacter rubrisoli]|uniref:DUF4388 domain-containing protein n=1 Tax=Ktedonosporobacter rubrisoli TaxID=2509675 RepID=UPI0013EE78EC|nr:DUF4388 domain-containing protein [Ktedonosporobacter rubrisoli]